MVSVPFVPKISWLSFYFFTSLQLWQKRKKDQSNSLTSFFQLFFSWLLIYLYIHCIVSQYGAIKSHCAIQLIFSVDQCKARPCISSSIQKIHMHSFTTVQIDGTDEFYHRYLRLHNIKHQLFRLMFNIDRQWPFVKVCCELAWCANSGGEDLSRVYRRVDESMLININFIRNLSIFLIFDYKQQLILNQGLNSRKKRKENRM